MMDTVRTWPNGDWELDKIYPTGMTDVNGDDFLIIEVPDSENYNETQIIVDRINKMYLKEPRKAMLILEDGTLDVIITENSTTKKYSKTTEEYLGEVSRDYVNQYAEDLQELGFQVKIVDIDNTVEDINVKEVLDQAIAELKAE